jgi:large repetitive protein
LSEQVELVSILKGVGQMITTKKLSKSIFANVCPYLILLLSLFIQVNAAYAAIAVSKSIAAGSPSVVNQGDPTRFLITLTNSNTTSAVNGVAFNDNLAAGQMTVGTAGLVSNSCGGTVTAVPGSGNVILASGVIPIAPGGATPGVCNIVVEVRSVVAGSRVNTIPIGGVTGNDGAAQSNSSQAQQSYTVLALNPPVVAKSFSPSAVIEDDPASTSLLTITINNPNASSALPLTTVTDNLPAGMQVASTPSATINCTGTGASNGTFAPTAGATTLTLTGGVVGNSGTCTLTVRVVGTASGPVGSQTLTNTINPVQVGNTRGLVPTSPAAGFLTVSSPIRVVKTFTPNPIGSGQQATLTITLFNDSSTANTVTTFDDSPIGSPAGLVITAAPSTSCAGGVASVISASTGVRLTGGTLPANGSCTITIPFTGTLPTPGLPQTFIDDVAANAVGNTGGFLSQPTSASVEVNDELTASKSVNPTEVAPGNPMTYSVTVNNFTGVAQNNITFTDNLPSGIIALASPAPAISGAGCSLVSTTLVTGSTAPQFVFNMPAGAVPNPSSCTITFTSN